MFQEFLPYFYRSLILTGTGTVEKIQVTQKFEFPAKTVFEDNSTIIDLRARF